MWTEQFASTKISNLSPKISQPSTKADSIWAVPKNKPAVPKKTGLWAACGAFLSKWLQFEPPAALLYENGWNLGCLRRFYTKMTTIWAACGAFIQKWLEFGPPAALLCQNIYILSWTGIVQKPKIRDQKVDNIGSCPDNSPPANVIQV